MNLPSVKTLMKIDGMDIDWAKLLRKVLECKTRDELADIVDSDLERFSSTDKWWRGCWNQPSRLSIKLSMADDIIEGCGVEYSGEVDMRDGPPLEYVNQGDTYAVTLCWFRGRYVVSTWGDIVERHERLFRDM